jgi:hypothetical protein
MSAPLNPSDDKAGAAEIGQGRDFAAPGAQRSADASVKLVWRSATIVPGLLPVSSCGESAKQNVYKEFGVIAHQTRGCVNVSLRWRDGKISQVLVEFQRSAGSIAESRERDCETTGQ